MNQIAKRDDNGAVVQISESAAVMEMISRAAADPNVDIDKMERLMAMRERMLQAEAGKAFDEAMNTAQEEMTPVSKDASNPQTRSKYASYAALDKALRPTYTKHGFSLSFDTDESPLENHVRIVCEVSRGGYSKRSHVDMPADGKGAKGGDVMTKTHATMSAISYGKRGLLKMVFNIAESDDDGNKASDKREYISPEQKEGLIALIKETGTDTGKFCQFLRVASLDEIYAMQFKGAMGALMKKKGAPK
jgi:hypothetical protein